MNASESEVSSQTSGIYDKMAKYQLPYHTPTGSLHCKYSKKHLAFFFIFLLLTMSFGNQLLYGILNWLFPQPEEMGISQDPSRKADSLPQQIHISLGKDVSEMEIVWATKLYGRSRLYYGLIASKLNRKASVHEEILTYKNANGCRFWHHAVLKDLEPDTTYYYQIQGGNLKSDIFHLHTLKNASFWGPKFMAFGNLPVKSKSLNYIVKEGKNYDAVFHIGDIAFDLHSEYGNRGDVLLNKLQPLAAYTPYMAIPGDREEDGAFAHFRQRFSFPGVVWPIPETKMYYSKDIGNVHLIVYNPMVYITEKDLIDDQYDWLLTDLHLATENRNKVPWIIVMGHRPLYCTHFYSEDCQFENSAVRQGVEELFYYFGVDLVIQAHEHLYERSWPVYKDKVYAKHYNSPKAPVYIISGSTGNEAGTDLLPKNRNLNEWSAFLLSERDKESISHVNVINNTHLHFQQILTNDGKILDEFYLKQLHHGPFRNLRKFMPAQLDNLNVMDFVVMQKTFNKAIQMNYISSLLMFIAAAFLTVFMVLRQIAMCRKENQMRNLTTDNVFVKLA